jgi:hypothetical protein
MKLKHTHDWHLVSQSPWPIYAAISSLFITIGAALTFHFYEGGTRLLMGGLLMLIAVLILWWRDVLREGFQGHQYYEGGKGITFGICTVYSFWR